MEVLALCFTRPIVLGGFVSVLFRLVIAGYYGAEVPLADSVQLLQSTASTVYSQRRYVEAYNTIHTQKYHWQIKSSFYSLQSTQIC